MDEKEKKKEYLEKIENLIYSAKKFNEMSFRMVLEGLIAKGGEEAEYLLVRYINANDIDLETRVNIIRVSSYILSPHFLIPLKKIIDTEENIHLKKEAVIAVSKYNDRRAFNILNHTLANIKNPLLLQTINDEIAKIKKNNPLFSLLPRFLDGDKNPKNFHVTIDILKRIINPTDAAMFVNYLACGKPLLENGAFEVLCYTASIDQKKDVFTFYQDRFNQITGSFPDEAQRDDFYNLTIRLRHFFNRFPELIDEELDNLGTQLYHIKEQRTRELFVAIIGRSEQPPAIAFLNDVYRQDAGLRECIIREYSGNEAAVELLFQKYRQSDETLKELLIQSLLSSNRGIDYFQEQFPQMEHHEQMVIVENMPYGSDRSLKPFIRMIFDSPHHELKENLLQKIHLHHEYSAHEFLFDIDREEEFFSMERRYLETITSLFPVSTVKKLWELIIYEELTTAKTRKYLNIMVELLANGLSFKFPDKNFVTTLHTKIVLQNNPELNILLMSLFKQIKTLDDVTLRNFSDSLAAFIMLKEKKMSVKEGDEMRKAKKNLQELNIDLRRIEETLKTLERHFNREVIDFEDIGNAIQQNGLTVALKTERVLGFFRKHLTNTGIMTIRDWLSLLNRFPILAYRAKEMITDIMGTADGAVKKILNKYLSTLPQQSPRIVIRLSSKPITALVREQCMAIIPEIPVETRNDELNDGDLLLCDPESLKEFILKNTLPEKKLFLLLDKRSDFSSYKSYNPHPLVKPFSAFRIIKEILKEFYVT